jgi:hypothetical protein
LQFEFFEREKRKNTKVRLTYLDKVVLDHVEAHFLVLGGPVLGQGVVHIEPIELDLLQGQRSIHEDSKRDQNARLVFKEFIFNQNGSRKASFVDRYR